MRLAKYLLPPLLLIPSGEALADQKSCLVEAVYHEARGEPLVGQLAVANVILNRVRSPKFPQTICEVVHDGKKWKGHMVRNKCAFSYYCDGKKEWLNIEHEALQTAIKASYLAINGATVESTQNATFYHASYAKPFWSSSFKLLAQIGQHKFYTHLN